jgi:DNA helicase-2/ATP-dependent DNA helicase PcrA
LLAIEAIQATVRASFDAIYVDEYQDCSRTQHAVVLALSAILPMRVLGDPLQGIFDFGESELVTWGTDVEPHFAPLEPLSEPHRWAGKNPVLGAWLGHVREHLNRGEKIDLRGAPNGAVRFIQLPGDPRERGTIQRQMCSSAICPNGESLVAIHNWEAQCHKIARDTGGKFRSLETMECDELFRSAGRFDDASGGQQLAQAVFEFACLCLTQVKTDLEKTAARIFDGRGLQANRSYRHQEQLNALVELANTGTLKSVRQALVVLRRSDGAAEARYELFYEMLAALREHETGKHSCLKDAAVRSRDRTRRSGRAASRYVVGRTLLIKGQEFDHALILDAGAFDRKNLYVALTRASRTLTVLSVSPVLSPR